MTWLVKMTDTLVINGISVNEAAIKLLQLGFRARQATVNDCGFDESELDFFIVQAKSPAHAGKVLAEIKEVAAENDKRLIN